MLETLILKYGYALIAAGTFLEGETVLVIGGYLAHAGYLNLTWVMIAAFAGSFTGDQLFFYIGRKKGIGFLEKRKTWHARVSRVRTLFDRHRNAVILGFRFVYGMRTVTPFLLGTLGVSPLKFLLLNALGAALWTVCIGLLGYFLGHAVSMVIAEAHRYELYGALLIAAVAAVAWGWRLSR